MRVVIFKNGVSSARMVKNDIVSEMLLTEKKKLCHRNILYQDITGLNCMIFDMFILVVDIRCSIDKYLYSMYLYFYMPSSTNISMFLTLHVN